MVKKKVVKKTSSKKTKRVSSPRTSSSTRNSRKKVSVAPMVKTKRNRLRLSVAFNNLVLFLAISLISFGLSTVSNDSILVSFFQLLSIISVFVSVAFLIVFVVLALLRFADNR